MNKSLASLKERLAGWVDAEHAAYEVGVCLGLWTDFGAPTDHDPWHGFQDLIKASHIGTGWTLDLFLTHLVQAKILEQRTEPNLAYRWNASFSIEQEVEELKFECHKCRGKCRPWNHAGGYWDPNKEGHG